MMVIPLWMSLLSFGLRNWKYILIGLALLSASFFAAWQIQGVRVDLKEAELQKKKVEITALKKDLQDCQAANAANQETIGKLRNEVAAANKSCDGRMKVKEEMIKSLKRIDGLKPKKTDDKELKNDEKTVRIAVDDPILHELDRMFINKADRKD